MILADVFYRYTAVRYWRLFQTNKTNIVECYRRYQPTKAQASRVGLRSGPSIAKR